MSTEEGPKSAYELAMERLRKTDADAGVDGQPLTEAQRAAILDIRQLYGAKIAELEILHESASVDLMCGARKQIDVHPLHIDGNLADGLRSIRMKQHATLATDCTYRCERLQHADFVVGCHDRHHDGVRRDRTGRRVTRKPRASSAVHVSSTERCSVATDTM